MHLFVYKCWLLLRSIFRPRITDFAASVKHTYWVTPFDLDEYIHMNNARYLNYMELGRFDLVIRSGFFRYALKHKIMAPVVNTTIVYRRSLQLFQKFTVSNQLVYWDEHRLFVESVITRKGKLYCVALKELRMVQKGKAAPLDTVMQGMGIPLPELPFSSELIQDKQALIKQLLRHAEQKFERKID
jgi:YbgC/YbaW family acyl-CoA thioester hydrolase